MMYNQQDMTVCQIIKAGLKERGLKQKDLAQRIGKSTPALCTQLNSGYMGAEEWRKMAQAIGYKVVMLDDSLPVPDSTEIQERRLLVLERLDELGRMKEFATPKMMQKIEERIQELRGQLAAG